ncbi:hypothetical protein EDE15_2032 [Edaphobacter aggregans]|uniref:Outer membrane lipoprotein-sorting protein n=2 Tax=Edaphobacter aggregans TaxID=570835 RepID=A0A3R9WG90_9BACT|nr:hypothetical protein EDE15_2032 [Edaphobacter aggregans]
MPACMRFVSLVFALVLSLPAISLYAQHQDPHAQAIVRAAVQTELTADRDDHSRWRYRDLYSNPDGEFLFHVVETDHGSIKKKLKQNGQPLTPDQLRAEDARIQSFVNDPAQQAKQRKDGEQDDKRAENMLRLLPDAFLWTVKSDAPDAVTLAFTPDPDFTAPSMEARVFAAMAGEIVVSKPQNRIQSIKGKLIHDVKFAYGLFGRMYQGGTFNIERRELAPKVWQITESHIHIDGHVLLFKNIHEQEDEVKTDFRPTPPATTLEQAATILKGEPTALAAQR